jgi:MbtH protein
MSTPWDRPDAEYLVLVNESGDHSLWPASFAVPSGWTTGHGPADRESCLAHVREHWTDQWPGHPGSRP